MLRQSIVAALMAASTCGIGQDGLDNFLSAVESNNLYLRSMQDFTDARKTEYTVGLNPKNPTVSGNYVTAGSGSDQSELTVQATQQFNFPTVYVRKRELSSELSTLAELQYGTARQQVLLEAKKAYLQLAYERQNLHLLKGRRILADSLLNAYVKRGKAGDASPLEVNKARIYAMNIVNRMADSRAMINALKQKLQGLNGNLPVTTENASFPSMLSGIIVDSIEQEVLERDPELLVVEQRIHSYEQQIRLNKSLRLPQLGAGYSYRNEGGINFNGVNVMISIPLWQNKNLVESSQADLAYGKSALEERKLSRLMEVRQYIEQYRIKKEQLIRFGEALSTIKTREILERSLELGEIDIIEFVREEEYLFQLRQQYLETQLDYHIVVANMLKHRL